MKRKDCIQLFNIILDHYIYINTGCCHSVRYLGKCGKSEFRELFMPEGAGAYWWYHDFGTPTVDKQPDRLNAILLFREIVLSEKLYKGWD